MILNFNIQGEGSRSWILNYSSTKKKNNFWKIQAPKKFVQNYRKHLLRLATGWWRLIGCLQWQVIFRKIATNYRALLRKMTCEDKAPYDSTPPCSDSQLFLIGCLFLFITQFINLMDFLPVPISFLLKGTHTAGANAVFIYYNMKRNMNILQYALCAIVVYIYICIYIYMKIRILLRKCDVHILHKIYYIKIFGIWNYIRTIVIHKLHMWASVLLICV